MTEPRMGMRIKRANGEAEYDILAVFINETGCASCLAVDGDGLAYGIFPDIWSEGWEHVGNAQHEPHGGWPKGFEFPPLPEPTWAVGDRCHRDISFLPRVVVGFVGKHAITAVRFAPGDYDHGLVPVPMDQLMPPDPAIGEYEWADLEAFVAENPVVIT